MTSQPRLPGVEEDPKEGVPTWVWRNPNPHSKKVHRLYHEDAEKTACGLFINDRDPIERDYSKFGDVTCKSCRAGEELQSIMVVMRIPKSADHADLQQAADYIRENGVIPDWLREHIAETIANAIPKTPSWVRQQRQFEGDMPF